MGVAEAPAEEIAMEEAAMEEAADLSMSGMPAGGNDEGDSKKKIMIIGGAVAIVLVLGIVIWVSKK